MHLTHRIASAAAVAVALLTPMTTLAQGLPTLSARCAVDSLDPATAEARLVWAWNCATALNVKNPADPVLSYDYTNDTGTAAYVPLGAELFDYYESQDEFAANGYFGVPGYTGGVGINNALTMAGYQAGRISETVINGFQRWIKVDKTTKLPVPLGRPTYPTFGSQYNIVTATQLFPPPPIPGSNPPVYPNDCSLYTNQTGTTKYVGTWYMNGYCTSSCYTPEQEIRFATGNEKILDAMNALSNNVTTLAPGSTLQKIQLKTDSVASYTRDLHESTQVIFHIRTASGGELRVTDKHPVILAQGRVVEARSLKAGDQLIKANGAHDRIVSVTKTTHLGKVYNIKPRSTNRVSNILIAQGYLVGSSRYQNEDVDYINRIILGRSMPAHVIPR